MSAFAREYKLFENLKKRAKGAGLRIEIVSDPEDFTHNMSSLAIGPNRIKDFDRYLDTHPDGTSSVMCMIVWMKLKLI